MSGASDLDRAWIGAEYSAHSGHHRRHAPAFLDAIRLGPGQRLLDLGCGAGEVAARLAARFPDAEVVGVDAAPDMIAAARRDRAAPNLAFEVGRAQDLDRAGEFDVVVSIACLHWVPAADHPQVLSAVHRALRPGGLLLAEFGGAGNIACTSKIVATLACVPPYARHVGGLGEPWFFPSAQDYSALLEGSPFHTHDVGLVPQERHFTEEEFAGWLTSQTLLPWLVRLPEGLRSGFVADAVDRASAAARAGEALRETFVRAVVMAA